MGSTPTYNDWPTIIAAELLTRGGDQVRDKVMTKLAGYLKLKWHADLGSLVDDAGEKVVGSSIPGMVAGGLSWLLWGGTMLTKMPALKKSGGWAGDDKNAYNPTREDQQGPYVECLLFSWWYSYQSTGVGTPLYKW